MTIKVYRKNKDGQIKTEMVTHVDKYWTENRSDSDKCFELHMYRDGCVYHVMRDVVGFATE